MDRQPESTLDTPIRQKRQNCCVCLRTIGTLPDGTNPRPYVTERQPGNLHALARVWHYCLDAGDCNEQRTTLRVNPGCTGHVYLVNPDQPDEGFDVHHDVACPIHLDEHVVPRVDLSQVVANPASYRARVSLAVNQTTIDDADVRVGRLKAAPYAGEAYVVVDLGGFEMQSQHCNPLVIAAAFRTLAERIELGYDEMTTAEVDAGKHPCASCDELVDAGDSYCSTDCEREAARAGIAKCRTAIAGAVR